MTDPLPTGFLNDPHPAADGSVDTGRLFLPDVQWTNNPPDFVITANVTIRQIANWVASDLLWTDQTVQRGIRPEVRPTPPSELSLKAGFPDASKYIFDRSRSEDMADKLLRGDRLFLNPLIWNLRPGTFETYLDADKRTLILYEGKIFLPDSHHRHQALLHAATAYRDAPEEYPKFTLDRKFAVEVYFMSRNDEGEYFYEKNQLGKSADRSKAFDLAQQDTVAQTARQIIQITPSLIGNVNRVTDRLSARNPQVMTLSTLVGIVRSVAEVKGSDSIASGDVERYAQAVSDFYELLATVRPELGPLSETDRAQVRRTLMTDSAVVLHGMAPLIREYLRELEQSDDKQSVKDAWAQRLAALQAGTDYVVREKGVEIWKGDFFDRNNPEWRDAGVLQPTKSGLTVSNTRQTRDAATRLLRDVVGI